MLIESNRIDGFLLDVQVCTFVPILYSYPMKSRYAPPFAYLLFPFYGMKKRQVPACLQSLGALFGVPKVIRTPDLPLRRRSLYPAELRKHITIVIISQFCNFVKCLFDKKSWLAIATSSAQDIRARQK